MKNTYSYELWKLNLNDCDPTSYQWFEGFFFWISLNICLRFILTINGILFGLNLYNILSSPSTHTHTKGKEKTAISISQNVKIIYPTLQM